MLSLFDINRSKRGPRLLAAVFGVAISQCVIAVDGVEPSDNVVLQWNAAALEAIRITHPGPPIVACGYWLAGPGRDKRLLSAHGEPVRA